MADFLRALWHARTEPWRPDVTGLTWLAAGIIVAAGLALLIAWIGQAVST